MWWRGGIVALVVGLGITLTVAWGWTAAAIYGFFVFIAGCNAMFIILWGRIAQRGAGWYYERQVRGHHKNR